MKKTVLFFVVLLFVVLLFVSCEGELPFILTRSDSDPSDSVVEVQPVMEDGKGYFSLSWEDDMGADSYIVMRAVDDVNLEFVKIYEGRETLFKDLDFESKTAYVYRLDKRRGDRVFKGEEYSYGFYFGTAGNILSKDLYEDNNSLQKAVKLEDQVDANVYAVKFNTGEKILYDEDWFYVPVPALFSLRFSIVQNYPAITSGQTQMKLYISTKSGEDESVQSGAFIEVKNNSSTVQNIYFRIKVDTDSAFTGLSSGQRTVSYTLRLDRLAR